MSKLDELLEQYGFDDIADFAEEYMMDSIVPGICMNEDCENTEEYEPDCRNGHCTLCDTATVKSGLILGGLM